MQEILFDSEITTFEADMTPAEIHATLTSHTDKLNNIREDIKALRPFTDAVPIIQTDLKWHGWIFWTVAGLYAVIFVTLFTGLLTWYLPKELGNLRANSSGDITNLQSQLFILRSHDSPQPVLSELSTVSQKLFEKSLPALQVISQRPVNEVNPSTETVLSISRRLRNTNQDTQDYWPTVLRFIQFASSAVSPDAPPPGPINVALHDFGIHGPRAMKFPPGWVILLDGGEVDNYVFRKCRIIFTDQPVVMRNVSFVDCVFEMPVTNEPSPYLKQAIQILIASDFSSVKVPYL